MRSIRPKLKLGSSTPDRGRGRSANDREALSQPFCAFTSAGLAVKAANLSPRRHDAVGLFAAPAVACRACIAEQPNTTPSNVSAFFFAGFCLHPGNGLSAEA